ncbi:MAG: hypothetical protein ACRC8K_08580, partial [Waterburya sp.]
LTQEAGNAGNIFIETEQLFVRDGATVDVSSEEVGNGDGGNINITTAQFYIDDESRVTAKAVNKGNSGNVKIKTKVLGTI